MIFPNSFRGHVDKAAWRPLAYFKSLGAEEEAVSPVAPDVGRTEEAV